MTELTSEKPERAHVFFSGGVQGVGFRYTCRQIAKGFSVTGWVRNLSDGRVEMVAEGGRAEVEAYLGEIGKEMKSFIRGCAVEWLMATGEWRNFHIEH